MRPATHAIRARIPAATSASGSAVGQDALHRIRGALSGTSLAADPRRLPHNSEYRDVGSERTEMMKELGYGFEKKLDTLDFSEAVGKVTEALKAEGFGVLARIDVRETLKEKLDVDFRRYVILGACNPLLARRALEAEAQIGLLLPCNVVVQEAPGGGTIVSIADPLAMFSVVDNPALAPVAREAEQRLRRVIDAVDRKGRAP